MASDILQLVATAVLGLLVGALLAEGALLIPYWQSLPAATFYALHRVYGPRLYRFFAPLTMAAGVLVGAASGASVWTGDSGRWATVVSCGVYGGVLATYGLYFRQANARFAAQSLAPDALERELARWQRWHWVRVVLGVVAFLASLLGINGTQIVAPR